MISRRLLLASLLCVPAEAFAQNPDPAAIVRSIYRKGDQFGAAAALQLRAEKREAVLSKSFAALWQRSDDATPAEDETPPGFDVASNSQGMDVARADVKIEKRNAARATVVARLTAGHPFVRHSPEENVVRYDFVRENGRWKIDDIRSTSDGREWSLRGILHQGLKANEGLKR